MKTPLPKVLHPAAGWPMVYRVVQAAKHAGAFEVRVVVGFGESLVRAVVEPLGATCFKQENQWGTADAVKSAQVDTLEGWVVVLNGDHPLITAADIEGILERVRQGSAGVTVITAKVPRPGDLGRIVRHQGQLHSIVEAKDASAETLRIQEVNTGMYVVDAGLLKKLLPRIRNNNAKGEYYFTDIIALAREQGESVAAVEAPRHVAFGVNSQMELAQATRVLYRRKVRELMENGVIVLDPRTTYVESTVEVGPGTVIHPGVYLRGKTRIGSFCVLEPHVMVSDSVLADSVQVRASSYLEQAHVGSKSVVGPFARLRPGAELSDEVQIGNFVEVKKSKLGRGAKASHLAYLGDAEIGEGTNIGCGTITCNYATDKKKYRTVIGKNVFVGSDTQFVAPISVGDGAVIGSGSTITKDVPARALAVARGRQVIKENYVQPVAAGPETKAGE